MGILPSLSVCSVYAVPPEYLRRPNLESAEDMSLSGEGRLSLESVSKWRKRFALSRLPSLEAPPRGARKARFPQPRRSS